jgi:hypothetical protein
MNRYDIEQIAYRSGWLGLDDSQAKKTAFLTTFEMNLKREIEDEKDDEIRRQDRFYSWED